MGFDFSSPLWAWREVEMALKYKQLHGHLNVMNDFVVPSDDSDGRRVGRWAGWSATFEIKYYQQHEAELLEDGRLCSGNHGLG
jgi:hypothetical protein